MSDTGGTGAHVDDPRRPPGSAGRFLPQPRPPWERGPVPAPLPPPARPSRRSTVLAGVLVVALLAWLGGVATFGLGTERLPRTAASGFVPPDGHRELAVSGQGGTHAQAMVESSWVRGKYMRWSVSPYLFRYMALPPGVEGDQVDDVQWWREGMIPAGAEQTPRYRVFSVTDDGVRLHGQDWGRLGMVFEPAPLLVPADVHDGQRWTQQGIATGAGLDGLLDYRMTAKAEPAREDGCVQVTTDTELTPQEDAASSGATRWTERGVWCQGRGVVDSAGTLGEVTYSVSTSGGRPADPLPDNAREKRPDPAGIASWRRKTLDAHEGDETFGTVPMDTTFQQPPVVTATGSIVFRANVTTDVVGALPVGSGKHWMHWWARPGGQVLSIAEFGITVVVTTSERKMMAYQPGGRLLWSVTLDDVSLASPVRVSDDRLAVASTRGVVSVRSAADGREIWSKRIRGGVSQQLASDGSVVAAIDNDHELHVLDARTGEELWTTDVGLAQGRVAVSEGTTVVATSAVQAFDSRTGERRWNRTVRWIDDLSAEGTEVAVDSTNGVEFYDLERGTPLQSVPGADGPRHVGGSWFVLTGDALVAVDGEGGRVGSWELTVPAEDREIAVGSAGVWVFGRTSDTLALTGEWVGPGG